MKRLIKYVMVLFLFCNGFTVTLADDEITEGTGESIPEETEPAESGEFSDGEPASENDENEIIVEDENEDPEITEEETVIPEDEMEITEEVDPEQADAEGGQVRMRLMTAPAEAENDQANVLKAPVETGISGFVVRLYRTCLGREYDEGGLQNWVTALQSGSQSAANVVRSFFGSKEFENKQVGNEEFVRIAYNVILDREPEEGGLRGWTETLEAGATKDYVLHGIVNSPEFRELCAKYGIQNVGSVPLTSSRDLNLNINRFVMRLYQICLGREYDESGLEAWSTALRTGSQSAAAVVRNFFRSKEFESKTITNEEFVRLAYVVILDREPEEGGLKGWTETLEAGATKDYVLHGIVNSPEFRELCAKYGIQNVGSVPLTNPRDLNLNINRFVMRLYRICLGREYDEAGLEAWSTALRVGTKSAADVIRNFFCSKEFESKTITNEEFVRLAYVVILDREPEEGGLKGWTETLEAGATKDYVLHGVVNSPEFRSLCAKYGIQNIGSVPLSNERDLNLSINKFVIRLYRECLGKEYDDSGLQNWARKMLYSNYSAGAVAFSFLFDNDVMAKEFSNSDFIELVYNNLLYRPADQSGFNTFSKKLESGMTRVQFVDTIIHSAEFSNKCKELGVTATNSTDSTVYVQVVSKINQKYYTGFQSIVGKNGKLIRVYFDENHNIMKTNFKVDGVNYQVDPTTGEILREWRTLSDKVFMEGIDISEHNGDINLANYQNNFVIIRVGWWTNPDKKAVRNMDLCDKYNIPYGVYLYDYTTEPEDAVKEAEFTLRMIAGRNIRCGVWFDMEDDGWRARNGVPANHPNISKICQKYCETIARAGYHVGIYASYSWFENYITGCDQYDKWVAHWGSNNGSLTVDMSEYAPLHQYTSTPLDKNVMYVDLSHFSK